MKIHDHADDESDCEGEEITGVSIHFEPGLGLVWEIDTRLTDQEKTEKQ